jgi:N-acetyl-alpha-D-muramate 1-phosphate uridylyltransferase
MILAAGRGERLRPLTDQIPKPLLQVRGKPLIVWHLESLARAGVREVVINLSWLAAQIREALGNGERWGVSIRYSDEGAVALETGGGIFRALPLLGPGPFILLNGDVFTDIDCTRLELAADAHAHLLLVPNPPHHPAGDFALQGDMISESGEPRYTYSGVAKFHPDFFAGCSDGRFPLLPLLRRAIANQRLTGELYRGLWTDVGTAERLAELNAVAGS